MLPKMQKTLINHPPAQDVIGCVVQNACLSLTTDSYVPWCSYILSLASSFDLLVPSGGTELLMHEYLTTLLLMPDSLHLAVAQTIRNRCLGSRCFCGRAAPLPYSDAEHFHLTHHLAAQPAATQESLDHSRADTAQRTSRRLHVVQDADWQRLQSLRRLPPPPVHTRPLEPRKGTLVHVTLTTFLGSGRLCNT